MNLLCFDVSSGGISAALFDSQLLTQSFVEVRWAFETDSQGAATLTARGLLDAFSDVIAQIRFPGTGVEIISIDTFLHSCLLLDSGGHPLTPVFTWLDRRGEDGVEFIRSRFPDFHQRTGCRFHPMFPVFKLASLQLARDPAMLSAKRIVSVKSFLLHELTGEWVEDHGTAAASGLFNVRQGQWDIEILGLLGFTPDNLPRVRSRSDVIGKVRSTGKLSFLEGAAVLNGTGDGFTAHIGSGCETADRMSVTLGTSAAVRQTIAEPALASASGTFCYMADEGQYLLGCAGSNGGNVLDWGRAVLKTSIETAASADPPIFIPLLNGERSPDWDPDLTGSWHLLNARHTAADLSRSILEGVVFNLAHFLEIVQNFSGRCAAELVLSGNGFLDPLSAPILAAVSGAILSIPEKPGVMSLRGAGVLGLRSLGQPIPALVTRQIDPLSDAKILDRYAEYRRFRGTLAAL